jgi:ferredoxin
MKPAEGAMTLAEMKEFAGFSASTQRYVRRALDIGFEREDALSVGRATWSKPRASAPRHACTSAFPNCARSCPRTAISIRSSRSWHRW